MAWINPDKRPFAASGTVTALSMADIEATHIAWAIGGSLVPEAIRQEYQQTFL